jgi:hypothetical protein
MVPARGREGGGGVSVIQSAQEKEVEGKERSEDAQVPSEELNVALFVSFRHVQLMSVTCKERKRRGRTGELRRKGIVSR